MSTKWKLLLITALAGLASYWFCPNYVPAAMPELGNKMASEAELNDFLRTTNEQYFYGALPANTRVVYRDMDDAMGLTDCKDGQCTIFIDPRKNPVARAARMTQLHEECHVYNNVQNVGEGLDGHGDGFQNCMKRLSEADAFRNSW